MNTKELIKECKKRNLPTQVKILNTLFKENQELPEYVIKAWLESKPAIPKKSLLSKFGELLSRID